MIRIYKIMKELSSLFYNLDIIGMQYARGEIDDSDEYLKYKNYLYDMFIQKIYKIWKGKKK